MEVKDLAVLIERAVDELHKKYEQSDAEVKAIGSTIAETDVSIAKLNETITTLTGEMQEKGKAIEEMQLKMERGSLPKPEGESSEEEAKAAHKAAFYKYVRFGASALDPVEKKALVEDATGLYLVEPELDAEIVRTIPTITIMRNLVTTRTIGKERIKMRSMGEVSVGWGKLETGADIPESTLVPGAPTYQYVEDLYGLTKIGEDELQDSDVNLEPILADSFARALGEAEETAFVLGTGHANAQPAGFTIDATLVAATQTTAAAGAVIVEEFMDMLYAVPTQFRKNGIFLVNSATELAIRKLRAKDGSGGNEGVFIWQPSVQVGNPNTLLGKAIYTQDDMLTLAGAAKCIAAFGDFKVGYRILDRQGITLQRLTELYAEAGLVGFKIHKRVGGGPMRASQAPISLLTEHA